MKIQHKTGVSAYRSEGFIGRYQRLVKDVVIPYQYSVLRDEARGTEKTHSIENFRNAGKALRGEDVGDGFQGMVFQDSDVAKWIEAAAYSLADFPDPELEKDLDAVIELVAEAQDQDGYLNTRFTVTDRESRWTNLQENHELYCAGHMMEAACAYYEATGKRRLLDVMLKNAEHIHRHFIMEKNAGFPGHPEIELALMKLYRLTGNEHCLELAEHFINTRGTDPDVWKKEAAKRGESRDPDLEYTQSYAPVREQREARGHAVRAVYLFTAMADLASQTDDKELWKACRTLWENITQKRMYVTGGIGSTYIGEAFTADYDLPSDTAYAETCASIGLMFFASRMLESDVNGEYADVMELAFYNTVLAGVQLDGKRFFYVNPLEALPGISSAAPTHRHVLIERPRWYGCACCPPNAARLISSFGQYAYGENEDTAFCHLYAAGEVQFANGMKLCCDTSYPYGFTVTYKIIHGGNLAVRIPAWSKKNRLLVNGAEHRAEPEKGYVYLGVQDGDTVELTLDDRAAFIYASPKVPALSGKAAVRRGPLIYCFEGADNDGDVLSLSLLKNGQLTVSSTADETLGGAVKIGAEAIRRSCPDRLYTDEPPRETACTAIAVPYYAWANRSPGEMRVWLPVD